jgi:hypothetical protein
MAADAFIQCRVSTTTKDALHAAAERQHLSESALVKRMIEVMLHTAATPETTAATSTDRSARLARLYVRLTAGDRALLRERAAARCLAPATYVSTLTRAHLRALTPLPKEELQALRQSITALGAIGRNINQIVKAANEGRRIPDSVGEEFRAMLKICVALRDNAKALLKANETSWETGNVQTHL